MVDAIRLDWGPWTRAKNKNKEKNKNKKENKKKQKKGKEKNRKGKEKKREEKRKKKLTSVFKIQITITRYTPCNDKWQIWNSKHRKNHLNFNMRSVFMKKNGTLNYAFVCVFKLSCSCLLPNLVQSYSNANSILLQIHKNSVPILIYSAYSIYMLQPLFIQCTTL